MMKISDIIRKWCDLAEADSIPCDELRYLADRIDAEMVELPKDADGKPIHIGDTMYTVDGSKTNVVEINFIIPSKASVVLELPSGIAAHFVPHCIAHERPDSFERIADELDEQAGSITKDGYTWHEDVIHDFADRIRKLAKEEEEDDAD